MTNKTIAFTAAFPSPTCLYRFRYRIEGTTGAYTIITGGNPIYLTSLPDNTFYEYLLDSNCCSGNYSTPIIGTFSTTV